MRRGQWRVGGHRLLIAAVLGTSPSLLATSGDPMVPTVRSVNADHRDPNRHSDDDDDDDEDILVPSRPAPSLPAASPPPKQCDEPTERRQWFNIKSEAQRAADGGRPQEAARMVSAFIAESGCYLIKYEAQEVASVYQTLASLGGRSVCEAWQPGWRASLDAASRASVLAVVDSGTAMQLGMIAGARIEARPLKSEHRSAVLEGKLEQELRQALGVAPVLGGWTMRYQPKECIESKGARSLLGGTGMKSFACVDVMTIFDDEGAVWATIEYRTQRLGIDEFRAHEGFGRPKIEPLIKEIQIRALDDAERRICKRAL